MPETIRATRTELLARRAQVGLAEQGRDLLRERRDQLMAAFRRLAEVARTDTDALARAARESRRALARAEAALGPEAVRSAALTSRAQIPVRSRPMRVAGVRVEEIEHDRVARPRSARGYSLAGSDPRIDAVAEHFEEQLVRLLGVARTEAQLRVLADEIGKSTRRVNGLELVVIPRLQSEAKFIEATLNEREREDHFRLKRIKVRKAGGRQPMQREEEP